MAIVEAGYFEEAFRRLQSTGALRGGVGNTQKEPGLCGTTGIG